MPNANNDSQSPPQPGGVIPRAQADLQTTTARSALTSGFGSVIEKEHALQDFTKGSLGHVNGQHATDLDRILRHQHYRLGANIALLEQRHGAWPTPERFVSRNDRRHPPTPTRRKTSWDEIDLLPDLITRHTGLLADIEALINCVADGRRGELILTEVRRNHEEMVWMLNALMNDDESAKRRAHDTGEEASPETRGAQENWDNEGGPSGVGRPAD